MIIFSLIQLSCFKQVYLSLEGKGDVAIVSFTLDKKIVHENDTAQKYYIGPGILNSNAEKATYWDYHKEAVNRMYNKFREYFTDAFCGTKLIDHEKVVNNNKYSSFAISEPLKILGVEFDPSDMAITADGFNYFSVSDGKRADSLCEALGVNLVMSIHCKARWRVSEFEKKILDNFGFIIKKIPMGHMLLDVEVCLHEKGDRSITWSKTYKDLVAEDLVELYQLDDIEFLQMDKQYFPSQLESAILKLFPLIKEDVLREKKGAEKLNSEQKS